MKLEEVLPYVRRGCIVYRMGCPNVYINELSLFMGFGYSFDPNDLFEEDWVFEKEQL